jgi:hypothetical protein
MDATVMNGLLLKVAGGLPSGLLRPNLHVAPFVLGIAKSSSALHNCAARAEESSSLLKERTKKLLRTG